MLALYNLKQAGMESTDLQKQHPEVVAELLPLFQAYLQDFSRRMRENKLYH